MTRLDRLVMMNFKSFAGKVSIPFNKNLSVICGPNGSGKSVSGSTEVLLNTGEVVGIGEVVERHIERYGHEKIDDGYLCRKNPENLKVLGLDLESMKIVEKDIGGFAKRDGEKYLYKITTRTGKDITCTGCHPVMVFDDKKIISTRVENLRNGISIATPRSLKIDSGCQSLKHLGGKPRLMDESLARLLGYLVGDGYIAKNRCEFVNSEHVLLDDFKELFERVFGVKEKYRKQKKGSAGIRTIFWDRKVPEFLAKLMRTEKTTSGYKKMPPELLKSSNAVLAEFLAGLFDCDAYFRKDIIYFEYCTKNMTLAKQVQMALLRFGITSILHKKMRCATNTEKKTKRPYYYIVVTGTENLERFRISIKMKSKKAEILEKLRKKKSNPKDLVPESAIDIIRQCANTLCIKYKPLKKKYPRFAAYMENRCKPSREGIRETTEIFNKRMLELENLDKTLAPDSKKLIASLSVLGIFMQTGSEKIGLNKLAISRWKKSGTSTANIKRLYNYIKMEVREKLQKAKELIPILEKISSSDIFWDEIVSVKKIPGEKWVYDLYIPNCHNFIANGIFVHNSNIMDAITFVIGTPRAKSIRADKLINLIFNGGRERKPAEWCEVSMYLDNSDGKIPGEKEIKITRRITRSGVSIYKHNGRTVNRSKIVDLLANANLSVDGHNIIMQGDVAKIIDMNPMQRKEIIEDISGISEFEEKRDKAKNELESVYKKISEMTVMVGERQRAITRLKEEKDKAEKFVKINAALRKSRASLYKKRNDEEEKKMQKVSSELSEKEVEFRKLNEEVSEKERELEKKEEELNKKVDEIGKQEGEAELYRKISEIRTEIQNKREKMNRNLLEIEKSGTVNRVSKQVVNLKKEGIYGAVSSLVKIPNEYRIAMDVAIGRHRDDIVVSDKNRGVWCIKYLKENKVGRARFIPLNEIQGSKKTELPKNSIGFAIDLIDFNDQYLPAIEYVLGKTVVAENIDTAKTIKNFRVVTLDGDIIEKAGAMIGGYYEKRHLPKTGIDNLVKENETLEREIEELEAHIGKLEGETKESRKKMEKIRSQLSEVQQRMNTIREQKYKESRRRNELQEIVSSLRMERLKIETSLENIMEKMKEFEDITEYFDSSEEELMEKIRKNQIEINNIGPVNLKAIEDFQAENVEFETLRKKLELIANERDAILRTIEEIEKKRYDKFMETLKAISENFNKIYQDLVGGKADLRLEEENNIDSGLIIEANPAGKKILNLDIMSGGEKSVTSLAFLFAVQQLQPAPFYILDEVDAALDKVNTKKIAELFKKYKEHIQFIVITHNDLTISYGDNVYGVSMDNGISKVFSIEMPKN